MYFQGRSFLKKNALFFIIIAINLKINLTKLSHSPHWLVELADDRVEAVIKSLSEDPVASSLQCYENLPSTSKTTLPTIPLANNNSSLVTTFSFAKLSPKSRNELICINSANFCTNGTAFFTSLRPLARPRHNFAPFWPFVSVRSLLKWSSMACRSLVRGATLLRVASDASRFLSGF